MCKRLVRSVAITTLEHAKEFEQIEEEVDDVEVQGDRCDDIVVGAKMMDEQGRVIEDVANEDEGPEEGENHATAEAKVEERIHQAPDDEDVCAQAIT